MNSEEIAPKCQFNDYGCGCGYCHDCGRPKSEHAASQPSVREPITFDAWWKENEWRWDEEDTAKAAAKLMFDSLQPSVREVAPTEPKQIEWLLHAMEQGRACVDYLHGYGYKHPGAAGSLAEESAFYAFRAFPELRQAHDPK